MSFLERFSIERPPLVRNTINLDMGRVVLLLSTSMDSFLAKNLI